jgi:uncharacterized protein YukE
MIGGEPGTVMPGQRPEDLVPGRPDEIEQLAARLVRFAGGVGDASLRLGELDPAHWSGHAADLFREAVGPLPQQLSRAGTAFDLAARALRSYADAVREGQAAAAQAIHLVQTSTPATAVADQASAARMVERARAAVEDASRSAASRLAELAAAAPTNPSGVSSGHRGAAVHSGGIAVRAVTDHDLADPAGFVAPAGDVSDSVRFGAEHDVPFADGSVGGSAGGGVSGWAEWAGQDGGRELGVIGPSVLAGLGIGAVGLIGRRRRDRTALSVAGLSEEHLRQRAERFGGPRGVGHLARSGGGGPRSADTWRTRLASTPRDGATVHVWAGSEANPLARTRGAEPVPMASPGQDVTGVVLRTGPPPEEGPGGSEQRADPS